MKNNEDLKSTEEYLEEIHNQLASCLLLLVVWRGTNKMSSNITEDILMTFVNDLEGEDWADSFLFDPSSSLQSSHVIPTRYMSSYALPTTDNDQILDCDLDIHPMDAFECFL